MPRPVDPVVEWALDNVDQLNNPTKEIIPPEFQQTGTRPNEPWVRVWMNYMFNNFSEYLKYLADDPVGAVRMVKAGSDEPQTNSAAEETWGGKWKEGVDSPVTVGGVAIRVFEKIEK